MIYVWNRKRAKDKTLGLATYRVITLFDDITLTLNLHQNILEVIFEVSDYFLQINNQNSNLFVGFLCNANYKQIIFSIQFCSISRKRLISRFNEIRIKRYEVIRIVVAISRIVRIVVNWPTKSPWRIHIYYYDYLITDEPPKHVKCDAFRRYQ